MITPSLVNIAAALKNSTQTLHDKNSSSQSDAFTPIRIVPTKIASPHKSRSKYPRYGGDHFTTAPKTPQPRSLDKIFRQSLSEWQKSLSELLPTHGIPTKPDISGELPKSDPTLFFQTVIPRTVGRELQTSTAALLARTHEAKSNPKTNNLEHLEDLTFGAALVSLYQKIRYGFEGNTISIWQYLVGTHPITVAAENKSIWSFGIPGETTSSKVRVNIGPFSTAFERTDSRLGWMQMRLKFYADHVSVKFESTSRAVNGLGQATEIRMSKPQWIQFREILKTKGEKAGERFLYETHGVKLSGLKRLTSITHGVGGFLTELGLFLLVGRGIDKLADTFEFDPDFRGRGPLQVGTTVALVQISRALWHKIRTGQLPEDMMQTAACATSETALTMGVFSAVGVVLDGMSTKLGVERDFWGRTFVQLAATYSLILLAQTTTGLKCRRSTQPKEDTEQKVIVIFEPEQQPIVSESIAQPMMAHNSKKTIASSLAKIKPRRRFSRNSYVDALIHNAIDPTQAFKRTPFQSRQGSFGAFSVRAFSNQARLSFTR